MAIPPYTAGYPQDGSSLGSSKSVIRNNLDGEFQVFSVDHFNQNGPTPGFHQQSTYPNSSFAPTTVSGQLALYSKAISGNSALYSIRDGDPTTETQITTTAFTAPLVASTGYTYLPGGLILEYGLFTYSFPSGTPDKGTKIVTFPLTFPNNVFNIQLTAKATSTSPNSPLTLYVTNIAGTLDKFTVFYLNNSSAASGSFADFYWTAIGN